LVAAAAVTGHRTRTGGYSPAAVVEDSHIDLVIVVREVVGDRKGFAVAAAQVLLDQDTAAVAVAPGWGLYCVLS